MLTPDAPAPTTSILEACTICGSTEQARLRKDWRAQVNAGEAIPNVGCGNPWHYGFDELPPLPRPEL